MKTTSELVCVLSLSLFSVTAYAESACTECYKAAQLKVAVCQRGLPAPKKTPTKDEQAARTKAESECNKVAIEANNACKPKCGVK